MALIQTIVSERGVVYPDQYVRVDRVQAHKTNMDIEVGVYLAQQQAADGLPPHRTENFSGVPFDMYAPENLWQQAYAIIKLRWPESIDA